jgi:uncharacterized coiled-coil DUF342 family protein
MDKMEKTHELENKLTRVQTDVSYLKKKMDKVEVKLESMDDKTDKLMNDLPGIFREIMESYVSRKEFDSFKTEVKDDMKGIASVQKALVEDSNKLKTYQKAIAWIFGIVVFLLSFGETMGKWLTSLVHQP